MGLFGTSKLNEHLWRVIVWKDCRQPFPISLEVDMTTACDHRCPHCVYKFAKGKDRLPLEKISPIIEQAHRQLHIKSVTFTGGGEPLLNSDTIPAIQKAHELGLDVGLITHGGHIDQQAARDIAKHCSWCRISLDAANATTFKKTHGVGSAIFDQVVTGIQHLITERKRLGTITTVGIGYLCNDETFTDAPQAMLLASRLGVDYLQFRPFQGDPFNLWEAAKEFTIPPGSPRIFFSTGRMTGFTGPRPYHTCHATHFTLTIGADFKVYPCCDTKYRPEASLGDLNETNLIDIWGNATKGKIFSFCPHPCRHNANNIFLDSLLKDHLHPNFI